MFKQGKFFAILGTQTLANRQVYCEYTGSSHVDHLRRIANKAALKNKYGIDDEPQYRSPIKVSQNPFEVVVWEEYKGKLTHILEHMREVRKHCGDVGVDPNSLRVVVVETSVTSYTPESPSDEETELRKYVLEKLSAEEKELLKVTHWDVYGKLADRTVFGEDEDD